ncbi:SMI1/KNR4 family protein [Nannocystis punicea]|uniref:SMI1/KNR4 family protein n=1 Tax=Nannocystis punicea TaxID=2995304 RepID=A0ABY7GVU7_9BACT|nr:SMI1/KNR4 family protein [Nannocystis poenicansa]WAS91095.1 SMI1/KNR4 family protein [Nannocystis poenicansa]
MTAVDDIVAFIRQHGSADAEAFVGVSPEQIARCEELCSATLPTLYREFLAAMGGDCGAFHPFGIGQLCDFEALVQRLPAANYPGDRYFRVSFESSPAAITYYDIFLDLRRSDGTDAPLVRFEDDEEFSADAVQEVGFTLGEELARSAFEQFEVVRRPASKRLAIFAESVAGLAAAARRIAAQLRERGLAEALPGLPRIVCLHSESLSVLIERREALGLLQVVVGAKTARAASGLVEVLLAEYPEARMVE